VPPPRRYSTTDEQIANQFIEGCVDPRPVVGLARALAKLHCAGSGAAKRVGVEVSTFNELVRGCTLDMLKSLGSTDLAKIRAGKGRLAKLANQIPSVGSLFEALIASYERRDCLIHSDTHAFNMLVEPKPSTAIYDFAKFAERGTFTLVDFEMSMAGPIGKDAGTFMSFPLCAVLAHARDSNNPDALDIRRLMHTFWDQCVCASARARAQRAERR
jgi:hypothetical protein